MSLRTIVLAVVATILIVAAPLPAGAGQSGFSITPMAGYRGGGVFDEAASGRSLDLDGGAAGSLVLSLEESTDRWYELIYSRQETSLDGADLDLTVQYLHLGGMAAWPQNGFSTYLAAGVGATWLRASGGASGSDTRPSFSIGLGLLIPLSERVAVRLESRAYLTLTDGDREFFCASGPQGGVCRVRYDGDVLTQIDAMAGLTFRF
jgi:opacity protein-like surface antigen